VSVKAKPPTPASSAARQASARLHRKVDEAVEQIALARKIAHQAQIREAVTRSELTAAVADALAARAAAEAARREAALGRYLAQARPRPVGECHRDQRQSEPEPQRVAGHEASRKRAGAL